MEITGAKLVVWIVVGMLAGSLTGLVVKRRKAGFGRLGNLGLGLAGAVIGGVVFSVLRIDLGTHIAISLHDILSAFVGALILLGVVAAIRRREKGAGAE